MAAILTWVIGGARRYQERRVACPCSWWREVGGEVVEGMEEVWFPELAEFCCEACGATVRVEEGEE